MASSESGAAPIAYKGRLLASSRNNPPKPRRSRDEPTADLDLSRPPEDNLRSLFRLALSSNDPSYFTQLGVRVGALNSLVHLMRTWRQSGVKGNEQLHSLCGFSMEQILLGVRCLLTSDAKEVRTGALRVIRYLVRSLEDIYLLVKLNIDTLIARSLDIVVSNRVERMQCLRLINHLLVIFYREAGRLPQTRSWSDSTDSNRSSEGRGFVEWTSPYSFPHAVIRPLIALSVHGLDLDTAATTSGQDKLCRAATGLLAELSVVCPDLVLSVAGTGWLLRALLGSICAQPRLGEVVSAVAVRWLDRAAFRRRKDVACLLDELVAPLTDPLYRFADFSDGPSPPPSTTQDEKVLGHCRVALVSMMRTWAGLLTAFSVSKPISSTHSPLALLVDSLGLLRCTRTRSVILEICADLLHLPYADAEFGSWEEAVALREERKRADEYETGASEGFVVADLEPTLRGGDGRPDLKAQIRALTLYGLLSVDVLEALVRVVLTEQENSLSHKATLIIADILRLMPGRKRDEVKDDKTLADKRGFAEIMMHRIDAIRDVDERGSNGARNLASRRLLRHFRGSSESVETEESELRRSGAVSGPSEGWDWGLVGVALRALLCKPDRALRRRLEEQPAPKFIHNLFAFFNPKSGQYTTLSAPQSEMGECGCLLMELLSRAGDVLNLEAATFLGDFSQCLSEGELEDGPFSRTRLIRTSTLDFFTMLGELTTTASGLSMLQTHGISHRLMEMMTKETNPIHVKLIVSSLDYSGSGFARSLLQKALNATSQESRMYATRLLGVWGRLSGGAAFAAWGVEKLTLQLLDPAPSVVAVATELLLALLWDPDACAAFGRLNAPMLGEMGEAGLLLRSHLYRLPSFVEASGEAELELWSGELGERYVDMAEEALAEGLSHFRRSPSGLFPRHSNLGGPSAAPIPVPPHLFGQLAATPAGLRLLAGPTAQTHLTHCVRTLRFRTLENDEDWKAVASALWALGHAASSDDGLALLPPELPAIIAKIAEESPVLSIRGVAFSALNLVSQCEQGRSALEALGWLTPMVRGLRRSDVPAEEGQRSVAHSLLLSNNSQPSLLLSNSLSWVHRNSVLSNGELARSPSGNQMGFPLAAASQPEPRPPSGADFIPSESGSLKSEASFHCLSRVESAESGLVVDKRRGFSLLLPSARLPAFDEAPPAAIRPLRIACCEYDEEMNDGKWVPQSGREVRSGRSRSLGAGDSGGVRLSQSPSLRKTSRAASIKEEGEASLRSHSFDDQPSAAAASQTSIVPPLELHKFPRLKRAPFIGAREVDSDESDEGSGMVWDTRGLDGLTVAAFVAPVEDASADLRRALGFQLRPLLPRAHPSLVNDPAALWRETGVPLPRFMGRATADGIRRLRASLATTDNSPDSSPTRLLEYGLAYTELWPEFSEPPPEHPARFLATVTAAPVCLPVDIGLVCGRINDLPMGTFTSPYETGAGELAGLPSPRLQRKGAGNAFFGKGREEAPDEVMGLRYHLADRCLHCAPKGVVVFHSDSGESGLGDMWSTPPRSRAGTEKEEGTAGRKTAEGVRKELLRLVCALDVRRKMAETGLLRLREEVPAAFANLCIYSDVCALLSRYRFRLPARRFLQELFLDIDLTSLWEEPDKLFGVDERQEAIAEEDDA